MARVFAMRNDVRHYDWGSAEWIPQLIGVDNKKQEPFAELWMGAHAGLPSRLASDEGEVALNDFIARDPRGILGAELVDLFGPRLPFLFKLLAAAKPLSIQAHPSIEQAREGWSRENAAGIPLTAHNRNYKDDNHKPELVCALTQFRAMCGFRSIAEIRELAKLFGCSVIDRIIASLPDREFYSGLLTALLNMDDFGRSELSAFAPKRAAELAEAGGPHRIAWDTVSLLCSQYPGDQSVIAPLYLNAIELQPGQALFLPSGILHAYCRGFSVEIMANSDNVLRGGLTSKYIDIPELVSSLRFEPYRPDRIEPPHGDAPGMFEYATPAKEFALYSARWSESSAALPIPRGKPAIVLCTEGALLVDDGEDGRCRIMAGQSAFVSADAPAPALQGTGKGFIATVNARVSAEQR